MRGRVARSEVERPTELRLGPGPIPVVLEAHQAEGGVGFGESIVELDRSFGRDLRLRERFPRWGELEQCLRRIRVRQAGVCQRIRGVLF